MIREYFKNLYSIELEKLKEIDGFLVLYEPPKLNKEEINNLIDTHKTNSTIKILTHQYLLVQYSS